MTYPPSNMRLLFQSKTKRIRVHVPYEKLYIGKKGNFDTVKTAML